MVFRALNVRALRISWNVSDGDVPLNHYIPRETVLRWKEQSDGLDGDKPDIKDKMICCAPSHFTYLHMVTIPSISQCNSEIK